MTLTLAKNIAEIFCEEEQQRNEVAICRTDKLLKMKFAATRIGTMISLASSWSRWKRNRNPSRPRRASGKHLCILPLYGYKKDENDKEHWVIDEEAAEVVKEIFRLCMNGYVSMQISRLLSERGVESPTIYKKRKNLSIAVHETEFPELWSSSSVVNILENPAYLGHTVNFRTRKKSYKSKKTIDLPPEKWVTFENTHEAIIDEETFITVQKIREARRRPSKLCEISMFRGLCIVPTAGKGCISAVVRG